MATGPTKKQAEAAAKAAQTAAASPPTPAEARTIDGNIKVALQVLSVTKANLTTEVVQFQGAVDDENNFHAKGEPPCVNLTLSVSRPELLRAFAVGQTYQIELTPVELE